MSARVFVLGSFAVDTVYRTPRLPLLGETLIGSGFLLGPGGKGSNQAVAAARAGAEVTFLSAIGRDRFGDLGRSLWKAEGINDSLVKVDQQPTAAAAILVDETSGANAIVVASGACSTLSADDVDAGASAIREASVFVAQLEIPLAAVIRGLQIAKQAGVPTILNPAPVPPTGLPAQVFPLVDYLIPNEAEAGQLTGISVRTWEEAELGAIRLLEQGCRHALLTLGERGSLLSLRREEQLRIPAVHPGPVVDTTGAGDTFCGAFATALAQGHSPEEAARFASVAAALSVTRHGAALSTPYRREIELLFLGGLGREPNGTG